MRQLLLFIFFIPAFAFASGGSSGVASGLSNVSYVQQTPAAPTPTPSPTPTASPTPAGCWPGSNNGTTVDGSDHLTLTAVTNVSALEPDWAPSTLVNHWSFDNVYTDDVGGNTGTPFGTVGFSTTRKLGTQSLDLPSATVGNGVSVSNLDRNVFSASLWMKQTAVVAFTRPLIQGATGGWELTLDPGGFPKLKVAGGGSALTTSSRNVADTDWHHIAVTYDSAGTGCYYIDNVSGGCYSATATFSSGSGAYFLGSSAGVYMQGQLDDISIFSTKLSAADINTIYQRQAPSYAGVFTSQVYDHGSVVPWTGYDWTTTLPFYKEFPSNGVSETNTDYPSISTNTGQANAKALWHFNEASGTFADSSGNTRTLTSSSTAPTYNQVGAFQGALQCNGSGTIITGSGTGLSGGASPRTMSIWFNNPTSVRTNFALLKYGTDTPLGSFAFDHIGNDFYLDFAFGLIGPVADTGYFDAKWHNAVGTYDGTTARLYLDGASVASGAVVLNTSASGLELCNWASNNFGYNGLVDEAEIWNRNLGATEVAELYQRGVSRAKFQVHSCNDNACSGESWMGPDGTSQTYFTELNNNSNQSAMNGNVLATSPAMLFSNFGSLTIPNNQYWQYRTILEAWNTSYTPTAICNTTHN